MSKFNFCSKNMCQTLNHFGISIFCNVRVIVKTYCVSQNFDTISINLIDAALYLVHVLRWRHVVSGTSEKCNTIQKGQFE